MSDLLARLRFEAETRQAVPAVAALRKEVEHLGPAGATAKAAFDKTTASSQGLERELGQVSAKARTARTELAGAATGAAQLERQANSTRGAAAALSTALGYLGLREIVSQGKDAAFALYGIDTGLRAVTGSAQGAAAEQGFLRKETERLGLVFKDQAKDYVGLAAAAKGSALAGEGTRQVWLATAEAGLVLGRSNEEISRALVAQQQILSKGKVSFDDLKEQLAEALPGSIQIAARAYGVSDAALLKMVTSGLGATEFLTKFSAQLRKEYGPALDEAMTTPLGIARRGLADFENGLVDAEAALGGGFLSGVSDGLKAINAELKDGSATSAARELGQALGEGLGLAAQGAAFLVDHLQATTIAAAALVGVGVGKWAATSVTGLLAVVAANQRLAVAQVASAEAALVEARAVKVLDASSGLYVRNTQLVIAAERELAIARGAAAAGAVVSRTALGGLLSLVGGPWGLAFAGAAASVALLTNSMAEDAKASADAETASDSLSKALEETTHFGRTAAEMTALHEQASGGLSTALKTVKGDVDGLSQSLIIEAEAARRAAIALHEHAIADGEKSLAPLQKAGLKEMGWTNFLAFSDPMAMALGQGAKFSETSVAPKANDLQAKIAKDRAEIARLEALSTKDWASTLPVPSVSSITGKPAKADRAGARAEDAAKDLAADIEAQKAHTAALLAGAKALDEWKIAEAGRQAVERLGLADRKNLTTAEQGLIASIRSRAEETERLKIANERIEQAVGLQRQAERDAAALQRRSVAALEGEAALERLRVTEAGLQVVQQLHVDTLADLTGEALKHAQAAIAAAEATERQAIATEKSARVAASLRDLDKEITSELGRRASALAGGTKAEIDYARAEFERQEIERAGTTLTEEQIAAIRAKADALFAAQAAADEADLVEQQRETVRLLGMSTRERELEERIMARMRLLQKELVGLTDEEARKRASILEMRQLEAEETAAAIGKLKDDVRQAFVDSGTLGFDQVADYAEKKLREVIYDTLLAKPIDVVINAVVGGISGLSGQLGKLAGSYLGNTLGSAGVGLSAGQSLGLGTGNSTLNMGLSLAGSAAGTMLAGSALSGTIGAGIANGVVGLGGSAAMAGSLGTLLSSAAVLGPIAAIAALALGTLLLKDDKRPYARTDIGVSGGQFAVTGGQELDSGPLGDTNKIGAQITQSLNAAADLFKLDLTKLSGNLGSIGYVSGKNTGALGQGYFGGGGGGFSGAEFTGYQDPAKLAEDIVRSTILKAIDAGASDLSEAEKRVVRQANSLEDAATKIAVGRGIVQSVDDAILQLSNPAVFERKQALDAVEASYKALKDQAQEMVDAGLVSGDVLTKIDQLHDLQVTDALERLGEAAGSAADSLLASFNDLYLTPAQKLAPVQAKVADVMGPLGLSALTTKDQFRDLVLALDTSTTEGKALQTQLLQVAPAFAQVADATAKADADRLAHETSVAQSRRNIQIAILEASGRAGDAEQALTMRREDERAAAIALDPTLGALVQTLQETKAASAAAKTVRDLENQVLRLTGQEQLAVNREHSDYLETLPQEARELQKQVWALEAAKNATAAMTAAAQESAEVAQLVAARYEQLQAASQAAQSAIGAYTDALSAREAAEQSLADLQREAEATAAAAAQAAWIQTLQGMVGLADEAAQQAESGLSDARDAVRTAYDLEAEALGTAAGAIQENIDKLNGFTQSLKAFRQELSTGSLSGTSSDARFAASKSALSSLAANSSDPASLAQLEAAAKTFLDASSAARSNSLDYQRDVAWVRSIVDAAQLGIATGSAGSAQQLAANATSLEALKAQVRGVVDLKDGPPKTVQETLEAFFKAQTANDLAKGTLADRQATLDSVLARQAEAVQIDKAAEAAAKLADAQAALTAATLAGTQAATAAQIAAAEQQAAAQRALEADMLAHADFLARMQAIEAAEAASALAAQMPLAPVSTPTPPMPPPAPVAPVAAPLTAVVVNDNDSADVKAAKALYSLLTGTNASAGSTGFYEASALLTRDGISDPSAIRAKYGFATGGDFMVGGSGGVDSQLVQFMASPNERVTVRTPGQVAADSGGDAVAGEVRALREQVREMGVTAASLTRTVSKIATVLQNVTSDGKGMKVA